ncbi:MAG TPA: hypothetical protein PK095_08440, partial [Myxococcota bacterium]|nr:hypothetical protein [Myxococcota bacterium]
MKSEPEPALRADPVEGLAAAVAAHAYRTSGVVDEAELTARVGTFAFFHGAPSDHHDAKACHWSAAAPNLGACITPTAISWHLTSPAPGPVPGPLPDGALAVHEESLSEVFFGANPRAAIVPEGGLVGTLDDRRGPLDGH